MQNNNVFTDKESEGSNGLFYIIKEGDVTPLSLYSFMLKRKNKL